MTQEQIEKWEYCNKYKESLKNYKLNGSVKSQHHGCGSKDAKITFELESIHQDLYNKIPTSFSEAEQRVQRIIGNI